jgi:hypothetical protein
MNQIKRIYISGPITGFPDGNKTAFYSAENVITYYGDTPINPHRVCAHLPATATWSDYMRENIPALCRADEIYMLRGWWRSRGARLEWVIAWGLGMKVRYE